MAGAGFETQREPAAVTSDITETAEIEASLATPEPVSPPQPRGYAAVSLLFLAVSLVLGGIAGLQLLVPETLEGVAPATYGKLLPVATNLFVYGWLTIGLAGALLYVVGRAGGVGMPKTLAARAALGLMTIGVLAGSVGVAFGYNEGRQYLEYPLWADAFLLLGFLALAATIGRMSSRAPQNAGPVRWYANAAVWWLVLAFVVGNIPGITGVAGAFQSSFFRSSLMGLWLAAAAIAVVYHVIPRIAGRPALTATRLTVLGFWSLTFVWAFTAPANLVYSPAPDWLETVGAVFSFGLIIPPLVILSDLLVALRSRWDNATGNPALGFAMLGGVLFAIWPVVNLAMALRSSSGIVQFTDWVGGADSLLLYGAVSSWLLAYNYHAAPDLFRGVARGGLGRLHYAGTVLGLLVWIGASLMAGLTAGWTWVASANEAAVPAAGVGFSNTLAGVEELYVTRFIGFVVFLVAQLIFVINVMTSTGRAKAVDQIAAAEVDPELVLEDGAPSRLRASVVAIFLLAATFVWLVPWAETAGAEATILADADRRYRTDDAITEGRALYVQEGCWYCHTQQVRPIVSDVGLGAVSVVGDYVYESPVLFGVQRIGPDLMHAGSRPQTDDPGWLVGYLSDPRSERSYSNMPSYDHLSASELDDLAAYIAASR